LSGKQKILLVGEAETPANPWIGQLRDQFDVVSVRSSLRALAHLAREPFAAVYVVAPHVKDVSRLGKLLENERLLESLPDGVVLLDTENSIVWANEQFRQWSRTRDVTGQNFYSALGSPEILGPDYCPFHSAQAYDGSSKSTLRTEDGRYFQVHAATIHELPSGAAAPPDADGSPAAISGRHLIVTIREVTSDVQQQQKLTRIHEAGVDLLDIKPDELAVMTVDERIELLKDKILHFTKDILQFSVVEIRLLDPSEGRLQPLLAVGMAPEAACRDLFARTQNNGVTGFVAATGKSYLCEDTSQDPLYLTGCEGAKSSLTVPLVLHDQVIGTFNVESTEPRVFSESDMQYLELFCRDLAVALNTLELLVAEKAIVAAESVEAIHSAVALPVDEILNNAVNVIERYSGQDTELVAGLQRILRNARDIKQLIQQVGQRMTPSQALPPAQMSEQRPTLRGRRILVADADETVRCAAHALLERYGCIVETARRGGEAVSMVRNTGELNYEAIIADIRLPDMTGYDLFVRLRDVLSKVPLILMTGFGYDPGHSIVKCRKEGLREVLYKPFRLDQLLDTVERVVHWPEQGA
jgi:CheY-like chemotaxis protein